jgi:hypothetical protein
VAAGDRTAAVGIEPLSSAAVALRDALPAAATGSPVVDAEGRLLGLVDVAVQPTVGAADAAATANATVLLPGRRIAARLGELRPGKGTVYVGWRRHYECAGRLDAYARSQHPGYRKRDARLNAPLEISRLPGTQVEGG